MSASDVAIRLFVNTAVEEPVEVPCPEGNAIAFTAPSPDRGDEPNQDSALVARLENGAVVLCVADGAGGMRSGDVASRVAIETMAEALRSDEAEPDVTDRVMRGFERAHHRIADRGIGAATTLAGVIIRPKLGLRSFHAGDSMAVVTGQRGRRKLVTSPHSPVGYAVEAGLIDEQEAILHERLHIVSNLVGVGDARIEFSSAIRLARRDTVLVASDGLFDNLLIDEVIERVRVGNLRAAVDGLIRDARERMTVARPDRPGKPDDLTILAYRPGA